MDRVGPPGVVARLLTGMTREVEVQLEAAGAIAHPAESGRAREEIIRRFLGRLVPEGFGIDTGFVIDSQGGVSRQQDIVIYHRHYHPIFNIGGVKYFIVEGVAAVIENKAQLPSRESIRDAIDAVTSVKRLDRTAGGANYYVDPGGYREAVNPDEFASQVFTGVVTETRRSRNRGGTNGRTC